MISVIVPIYNTEAYLRQCLQSIVDQTYDDLEILCLNDGSTDSSLSIMREFAESDSRIRVIDKENQGYGTTCNRGIAEAQGDYISIIEPDDWIEPTMYFDLIEYAKGFSQAIDIIKSAYWRIKDPDSKNEQKLACLYKGRIKPSREPFDLTDCALFIEHHPSIWSALYRRGFLTERAIRFREIPGAGWADNPFLYETLCQAESIAYLDQAYYCYREETTEQALAFARNNTFLPLERWNDQSDVLEQFDVHNKSILAAHNRRGFRYLNGIIEGVGIEYPGVEEAALEMFRRMDNSLVLSDPHLRPNEKALYAQLLELPEPRGGKLSYGRHLISDGFRALKNNGLRATLSAVGRFLERRDRRS